jgi:hypothetical protein
MANPSESSTATGAPTAPARTTTDVSKGTTDASGQSVRLIRRLVVINLALVAIEPISAGFFLFGYERAVTVHAVVGEALALGALIQTVIAVVLWRRRGIPGRVAGASIGLFVIVFLQVVLGFRKLYWLHVPIGVGIFSGVQRQLDTLRRTTGARS